jgi:hypothetical protein
MFKLKQRLNLRSFDLKRGIFRTAFHLDTILSPNILRLSNLLSLLNLSKPDLLDCYAAKNTA